MGVRLRRPETPVTGVDILLTREGVLKSETLKRDKNTAKSRLLRPASPLGLGLQRVTGLPELPRRVPVSRVHYAIDIGGLRMIFILHP